MRRGILTASIFRKICKSADDGKATSSLLKSIFGEYDVGDAPNFN